MQYKYFTSKINRVKIKTYRKVGRKITVAAVRLVFFVKDVLRGVPV